MAANVFGTERLCVRPWTHEDVEPMYDIYRRWEVSRWLGAEPRVAASVDEMHRTVDRWAALAAGPFGVWAVVPRVAGGLDGVPVGTVLLVPLQDGAGTRLTEVEVGWHLHPDAWGHGYATEAAQGAIDRGWSAGLTEVYAVVLPGNDPSVAVTRRLGMASIGRSDRFYGIDVDVFRVRAPRSAALLTATLD